MTYKDGEYRVSAHYGYWRVHKVHAFKNGNGFSSGSSDRICSLSSWESAMEVSFLLNGWGFPKFTIKKGVKQDELVRKAYGIISEHSFNRSNVEAYEKEALELFAKANVERFKHVIALIDNAIIRESLKQLWLLNYNYRNGHIQETEFKAQSGTITSNLRIQVA